MDEKAESLKKIRESYASLARLAQKAGFGVTPLDTVAAKCSVGDSCCAGDNKNLDPGAVREATPDVARQRSYIEREVQTLRGQYTEVVKELVQEGKLLPEILDLADSCGCGDSCQTGTTDRAFGAVTQVINPAAP